MSMSDDELIARLGVNRQLLAYLVAGQRKSRQDPVKACNEMFDALHRSAASFAGSDSDLAKKIVAAMGDKHEHLRGLVLELPPGARR